ncbi:acetyl-CoA carboxylase biotin carboxylase subunit [bacterium]|nr:acetyl-CoA carboxylase biotin carboxylase subunit [bacterium]
MFKKILIANRGEVALRVIRACQEMGIATVAVHSTADADTVPVTVADESICIGPAPVTKSYLNMHAILTAAKMTGAEAVHPGYGFLSENETFARLVQKSGLVFIGPSPDHLAKMGQKAEARKTMQAAGMPILPGSADVLPDAAAAKSIAAEIGYPVLLKAAFGGGGRGMRVVRAESELEPAFLQAGSEAQIAFGDGSMYLEKFIEKPHHIEIQILGDRQGSVVHLGERECSIQRRHQKLIEESPSPFLNSDQRAKMTEMARQAVARIGYEGAGTIELIVDESGRFYFMEMNTRLQVEHPVSEEITGIDIVKEQIRIAAGQALRWRQSDVTFRGHSIECRILAEDASHDFRPSTGVIENLHFGLGPGIRIETHIYSGYQIPATYDSLLAKMVSWGLTRHEAIVRMRRAIRETVIEGVPTTLDWHTRVLDEEDFVRGRYTTHYVQEHRFSG